jgi:6-phosphofructokinase 1
LKRIAVLTSGGDAPGMNVALAAFAKLGAAHGVEVLGVEEGYDGLIDGRFRPLTPDSVSGIWDVGGTVLASARSIRFRTPEGRAVAAKQLESIDALFVIGGNGSLTGASILAQEHGVAVVGLPASIDNDLACTSHAIGVDTALNTIVEACDKIKSTARSHHRAFIVEVMGRDCGYLAMASAIAADADAVLFREQGKTEGQLVEELLGLLGRAFGPAGTKHRVLIVKAEGVEVPTERLTALLRERLHTIAPKAELRYVVLGHLVRGGNPTFRDRLVASRLAFGAISAAKRGHLSTMVGWEPVETGGFDTDDPSVKAFPLDRVLTETAQLLDGTHPTTRRRVKLLEAVQGVLAL